MPRPRKYLPGDEPTPAEKHRLLVERLKADGGRRVTYNLAGDVIAALEKLKSTRPMLSETVVVSDIILAAASRLKR